MPDVQMPKIRRLRDIRPILQEEYPRESTPDFLAAEVYRYVLACLDAGSDNITANVRASNDHWEIMITANGVEPGD